MQHVANISIAVMYIMYFLAALFGYLTFYGEAWSSSSSRLFCLLCPSSCSVCLSVCLYIVILLFLVNMLQQRESITMHLLPLVITL